MAKKFPIHPKHPERICWGCDKYCPVDSMGCGNGSNRTQHPVELLGEDWYLHGDWGLDIEDESQATRESRGAAGEPPVPSGQSSRNSAVANSDSTSVEVKGKT